MEHPFDQLQEPSVADLLAENREQDTMVKAPKAVSDVSFDEPVRSLPDLDYFIKRGVAAPSGTESMGMLGKLGVVVRVEQNAHHFCHQFVRPRRHAQRAILG